MSLLLLLVQLAHAETRWAAADAEGVRWPDATVVSVKLATGDEVEVLATDGDKVRVRKGVEFGWVAAASLTTVAPAKPEPIGDGGELPDFTVTPAAPTPVPAAPAQPAAIPPK